MKLRTSRRAGFTLVEIMIVVCIIGLLIGMAIPNIKKARESAYKTTCIANLNTLSNAIETFAAENKKADSDPVGLGDLKPYIKRSCVCPSGGTTAEDSYSVTDCNSDPTCISRGGGSAKGHVLPQ